MHSAWKLSRRRALSDLLSQLSPQVLHLGARQLCRAAVVNDVLRSAALLVDRHLGGDDLASPIRREATPCDQALDLDLLGNPYQDDRIEQMLQSVLEQQRNVLNDDLGAPFGRLGCPRRHPLAHERVDYRVQPLTRVRVFENQFAQTLSIDAAIAPVVLAKLLDHSREARSPGLVNGVRSLVSIHHLGAELSQHAGDRRFPRTDPTR